MSDVIIIGAGITGLACAWRLKQLGIAALVLENSDRAGGVIRSEHAGEYLVECGPNSLLPSGENFDLLDETGLSGQIIEGDRRAPRYICIGGTLRKVPFGPLTAGGVLRIAKEPFIRSRSPENESIHDFVTRRLGAEAEERLVSPFVSGIYAGSTRSLSMAATFPKLVELERQHGSLIIGMLKSRKSTTRRGRTCSFAEGMESLPLRLARDCNILYNAQNVALNDKLQVDWVGNTVRPRAVVITAPAYVASDLLKGILAKTAGSLSSIEYAPIVVATVSVPDSAFAAPLRGFGFLVPRSEKIHLLGTLFSSALFPGRAPKGRQLLTCFLGGALELNVFHWPESRIWDVAGSEIQRIMKLSRPPEPVRLIRRSHAIPQYRIGHERLVASIKDEIRTIPGLFLAGNYLDGVSVSACLEAGERTARAVAAFVR